MYRTNVTISLTIGLGVSDRDRVISGTGFEGQLGTCLFRNQLANRTVLDTIFMTICSCNESLTQLSKVWRRL